MYAPRHTPSLAAREEACGPRQPPWRLGGEALADPKAGSRWTSTRSEQRTLIEVRQSEASPLAAPEGASPGHSVASRRGPWKEEHHQPPGRCRSRALACLGLRTVLFLHRSAGVAVVVASLALVLR